MINNLQIQKNIKFRTTTQYICSLVTLNQIISAISLNRVIAASATKDVIALTSFQQTSIGVITHIRFNAALGHCGGVNRWDDGITEMDSGCIEVWKATLLRFPL